MPRGTDIAWIHRDGDPEGTVRCCYQIDDDQWYEVPNQEPVQEESLKSDEVFMKIGKR